MKLLLLKTCGERICPHGHTHKQDNAIVNFNPKTNKMWYVCLSSECGKSETTNI